MDYIYANIDPDIIDSGEVKFTSVSAEVDNNSGTPSVDVSLRDDTDLHFFFHNLKGDQGEIGPQGIQGAQGQQGVPGMGLDNTGRLSWDLLKDVPTEFFPEPHEQPIATIVSNFYHEINPDVDDYYLPETLRVLNAKIDAKPSDLDDYYTNDEVDALLNGKADKGDILVLEDELAIIRSTKQDKLIAGSNIELEVTGYGTKINALTDTRVNNRLTSLESTTANTIEELESTNNELTETKVNLANISNTVSDHTSQIQDLADLWTETNIDLEHKVDKVNGKGLSEANFTQDEKLKLSTVHSGAQINNILGISLNQDIYRPTEDEYKIINLGELVTPDELELVANRVSTLEGNWPTSAVILKESIEDWTYMHYASQSAFKDFTTSMTIGDFEGNNVFKLIRDGLSSKVTIDPDKSLVDNEQIEKLLTIYRGAQPNVIEAIYLNGEELIPNQEKEVNLGNLVVAVEGMGLSEKSFTEKEKTSLNDFIDNFYIDDTLVVVLKDQIYGQMPEEPGNELLTAEAIKNYVDEVIDPIIQDVEEIGRRVDNIERALNNL